MPLLKDLNCSIELSEDQKPLQELGTVYGDAFVETFIPVPKKQQTFTVHLSSTNFIAPGIAMYVFIDGVYQCNRNRQNMKLRKPPDRRSLVDFKVRQKEEKQKDGSMIAREWTFEKLDHASADGAPDSCSPNILDNIGCIEVVVLRCAGPRNARTAANMNLDGATDYPDYRFDRDSRSRTIAYDDREPLSNTAGRHDPPPRMSSYRSPYAETVRSKDPPKRAYSRFSEPVSPGTRPQRDIPAPAFQYGSGPLPPQAKAHIHKDFADETMLNNAPKSAPTVDPDMLEKIVADAVKRGVAESRQNNMSNGIVSRDDERGVGSSSRVPGAWPTSPTHRSKHRSHRSTSHKHHDGGDARYDRNSAWEHRPTRSRAESHVAWDEEPGWDKQSRADGWGSPEDNASDSWDTGETWSKRKPDDWEEVCHRSKSRDHVARSPSRPRQASYISTRTPERQRLKHSRSHRSRSKTRSHWIDDSKTTSEDNDGWTLIEAPYDPNELQDQSDSTLQPSHSRSQAQPFKSKPGRRNSVHLSSQRRHERRLSQLVENPQWHPKGAYHARPPSVLVTNAPTVMSASISQWPADIRLRKQSVHTQSAASVVAPPPIWGCASQKPRKNSAATTYLPPAPFSTIGVEHHESRNSSGSSSWGIMGKDSSKDEEKKISPQQSTWGGDKKSDKDQSVWGEADNKETDGNADQRQGWGDDKAAEQNDDCWNNTEKDNNQWGTSNNTKDAAVDGWDIANNGNDAWGLTDTKDTEAGGWNMENNNSWEQTDPPKDEQNDNGGFDAGNADNNSWHTKQNNNTSWDQPQETTNNEPFNPDAGWAVEPVVDEKANEKGKSVSASKRHTSKSLSKYRQLSAPALEAKPHWQFPPPLAKKTLHPLTEDQASEQSGRRRRVPSVPSEPFYKFPKSLADEKGVQHQVLAGPGTQYGHAINRPEYMDHLDKPYAVFQFKYRSRSMLRSMFGNDCLSKSGTTIVPVQKEDLKALPHDELVKKMLALQSKLEDKEGRKGKEGEKRSQCTESVAMDRAEEWVKQHSRNASEQGKARKAATEKSKAKSAEKVAGWDDGGANGGEKWNGKAVNW